MSASSSAVHESISFFSLLLGAFFPVGLVAGSTPESEPDEDVEDAETKHQVLLGEVRENPHRHHNHHHYYPHHH